MKFQRVKGMKDYYPEDKVLQNYVFSKLRETAQKYNFKEIETPAVEELALLIEKEGEEIKQQIFVLEKRSKEQLGLRFDLTVPGARLFIEKQKVLPKPVKWFCIDKMWRYERPQAGRLREFYQYNCEIYGCKKVNADAEVIMLLIDSLNALGLTENDFEIRINNRKLLEGVVKNFTNKVFEVIAVIDKMLKLPEEEFVRELENNGVEDVNKLKEVLQINDISKLENYVKVNGFSNDILDNGIRELKELFAMLKIKEKYLKLSLTTARGLSYYSGTVFEAFDKEGKFRSIAGGGRYDNLISMFGGEDTPATGFAVGYATLLLLLESKNLVPELSQCVDFYVVNVGDSEIIKEKVVEIVAMLRKRYHVDYDLMGRNLRNQLKYANTINAKKVIFVGEDEIKTEKYKVKDMNSGNEEFVDIKELIEVE